MEGYLYSPFFMEDKYEIYKYIHSNREKNMRCRKVKFWCNFCDGALVGEYGKCPSCGRIENKHRKKGI